MTYSKELFEADLFAALEGVPTIRPSELARVEMDAKRIELLGRFGRGTVKLFQEQQHDHSLDDHVRDVLGSRPAEWQPDANGMQVTTREYQAVLPNPYTLTTYDPKANRERGEAKFFELPGFAHRFPEASRYITEREAQDYLAETAIALSESDGHFIARPEAEVLRNMRQSDGPISIETFACNNAPMVTIEVDPHGREEAFTWEGDISIIRDAYMHYLKYIGPAELHRDMGDLPVYIRTESGLNQLSSIDGGPVEMSADNPALFTYAYTDAGVSSGASFWWEVQRNEQRGLYSSALPFRQALNLPKALERQVISPDALTYEPVLATEILRRTLAGAPDTPYFQQFRRELGPAFNQEDQLIVEAHKAARQQWHEQLKRLAKIEPAATGFEDTARRAGIRRYPEIRIVYA